MPVKKILHKDQLPLLKQLYCVENLSQEEIGLIFNCHRNVIAKWIKENQLLRNYNNPDYLKKKHYEEKLTLTKIAELCHCEMDTITAYMRKYNIETLNEVRYSSITKYRKNSHYFDIIDNNEKAYWLGFILADGCIIHEACNTFRLSILLALKDVSHLEKFLNCINGNEIPIVHKETDTNFGNGKTGQIAYSASIRINDSHMCQALMNLNIFPKKSCNEKMPNIQDEYLPALIRGIFDGDGCFTYSLSASKRGYNAAACIVGSFEVLTFITNYLKKTIGINSQISQMGKIYRLSIGGNKQVKIFMDFLYSFDGPYLDRKKTLYEKWINLYNPK